MRMLAIGWLGLMLATVGCGDEGGAAGSCMPGEVMACDCLGVPSSTTCVDGTPVCNCGGGGAAGNSGGAGNGNGAGAAACAPGETPVPCDCGGGIASSTMCVNGARVCSCGNSSGSPGTGGSSGGTGGIVDTGTGGSFGGTGGSQGGTGGSQSPPPQQGSCPAGQTCGSLGGMNICGMDFMGFTAPPSCDGNGSCASGMPFMGMGQCFCIVGC